MPMVVTNFSKARKIPDSDDLSTKKSSPTTTNFAAGIFTYKPNDTMDYDEIYLAQNARFDRIGEYATRRGLDKLCEPVGKATIIDNYSGTYTMVDAEDVDYDISTTDSIYSINLTVATTNSTDYGVIQVSLVDEDDEVVAVSCWDGATTTPESHEFIFKDAPTGTLTVKVGGQAGSAQQFRVASVSSTLMLKVNTATAGKVISLFEANIDDTKTLLFVFKATSGTVTLYRMASDGTVTSIRQLPSNVTAVRFIQDINKIRYADGLEGPRLIDPSNSWSDSAISTIDLKTEVDLGIKVSNIMDGTEDNIMYFDADTTTQAVWTYPYGFTYAPEADFTTTTTLNAYVPGSTTTTTVATSTLTPVSETHPVSAVAVDDLILDDMGNYGEVTTISGTSLTVTSISHAAEAVNSYDKFDRDFRQNFPAIETGDPLTAMFNLGGVVYMLTRRNKYYMYSQTADVWSQETSSAQHGTFSQESVACNLNYAYYASDDGIYIFDGSSESSITQNTIQNTYDAITGKESIRLELFGNHLYVFYSSNGDGNNDSALVYNTNLKLWESFDTGLPVCAIIGRKTPSNRFICGSGRFGQVFTYDNGTNAYADLGAPIAFDLETAYLHFGTPSQLHRVSKWRPEFATTTGDYAVKCGYALDFSDDVEYAFSVKLKNGNAVSESYVWDNPPSYGVNIVPTVQSTTTKVYGEFRRIQFRYQLHTAFEPVNLKAVTVSIQTQRLR
jgi:hypothetical protein